MTILQNYDLPIIDSHKGESMRFEDVLKFSPRMNEARFTHDGIFDNFTQLALHQDSKDVDMIQRHLDDRGYRQLKFLGRGLYGLAFDADGKYVLNIRTINYYQYEEFAKKNGIETETVWSETTIPVDSEAILRPKRYKILQRGSESKYLVCECNKLQTLDEAIDADVINETQAECLRQSLMLKLADEGYFLWDGRFANIGIGEDLTPYVLDIGAAERFERLTNVQLIKGICNQNIGGELLEDSLYRNKVLDKELVSKIENAGKGFYLSNSKVFDPRILQTFLSELEQEMPPEVIIPDWDRKWTCDDGIAKQDSQQHFEQVPERNLFSHKVLKDIKAKTGSNSGVAYESVKDGLYPDQWRAAMKDAFENKKPNQPFCKKIRDAVEAQKDDSLKR